MDRYREDAGRRLLPHIVDELARDEPDRVLYEFPTNNDVTLPFTKVTAKRYANAVNRAAWLLHNELGRGEGFPTIGYTGPQDIRYFIFVVAAAKSGYKMLYTSPRNNVQGDIAVAQAVDCRLWLVPSAGSNVQRLLDQGVQLRTLPVPDLDAILDAELVQHYEDARTWETGRRDPAWVLHTSGSTGNPKPVVRFLDSIASVGANNLLPQVNGRSLLLHDYFDARVYLTFPLFHAAGLFNGTVWPLFYGTTVILGPDRPVSLYLMKEVITHAKPDAVFTAPSLVEEISRDQEFLQLLESVRAIAYGGGPVSREAGDRVWKHTKLRLSIGTTETGWLPCVETDPEDWNYIHLHPNAGFDLQDRGAGLYELVAIRRPELEPWQPIFSTFPGLQEYSFKDLFSRHPTKPDLYTYEGRADNIIVLSNGEKVQPHNMELIIGASPLVKALVIGGQGRFQTSAVVQLVDELQLQDSSSSDQSSQLRREQILDSLWPAVERANDSAPAHAKLQRNFIVIASPDKPLMTTSKGTVRRGPTLDIYRQELEEIYARAEEIANGSQPQIKIDWDTDASLRRSLREILTAVANIKVIGDDDDFFAVAGMDSLQVLTLRRRLVAAGNNPESQQDAALSGLTTALIYKNSSIALLSQALRALKETGQTNGVSTTPLVDNTDIAQILLDKYTATLPPAPTIQNGHVTSQHQQQEERHMVVVLTGSTGSLGSYILDDLTKTAGVREVWCLNRSADAEARQGASNAKRGLVTDFAAHGIRFRRAVLSEDRLDLDTADYEYLVQNVTHILHTQWQVNFNLALPSFEPHIKGVRNLIELASAASLASTIGRRPKLFFTSSVGVANNVPPPESDPSRGPIIPEQPLSNMTVAGPGYGESKLVTENLLLQARDKSGIDIAICRVGQIAGPVRKEHQGGSWSRNEWLPSIIDASAFLSKIPRSLGRNERLDWIPVDLLSGIILELAGIAGDVNPETPPPIFHTVNPEPAGWETALLQTVRNRITKTQSQKGGSSSVEVVSLKDWVDSLKSAAAAAEADTDGEAVAQLSAFKLVPFFSSLVRSEAGPRPEFSTEVTGAWSPGIRSMGAVRDEWMDLWMDQWGY